MCIWAEFTSCFCALHTLFGTSDAQLFLLVEALLTSIALVFRAAYTIFTAWQAGLTVCVITCFALTTSRNCANRAIWITWSAVFIVKIVLRNANVASLSSADITVLLAGFTSSVFQVIFS